MKERLDAKNQTLRILNYLYDMATMRVISDKEYRDYLNACTLITDRWPDLIDVPLEGYYAKRYL